jgi:hypothetical protein
VTCFWLMSVLLMRPANSGGLGVIGGAVPVASLVL